MGRPLSYLGPELTSGPLPACYVYPLSYRVPNLGEPMRRRSRAGGEPVKARRRKATTLKRGTTPKIVRRRGSSTTGSETKVGRLIRERDEALEQQTATSEILASISGSMTDPKPAFDAIVRNLLRLLGTRFASVSLLHNGIIEMPAAMACPGSRV